MSNTLIPHRNIKGKEKRTLPWTSHQEDISRSRGETPVDPPQKDYVRLSSTNRLSSRIAKESSQKQQKSPPETSSGAAKPAQVPREAARRANQQPDTISNATSSHTKPPRKRRESVSHLW